MPAIAVGAGAAISGITGLIGGGKASSASKAAADAQHQQYLQTRSDLLPYNTTGQGVLTDMGALAQGGPNGPGGINYLTMAQDYTAAADDAGAA